MAAPDVLDRPDFATSNREILMEALLSVERAAEVLGISVWTIRRYVSTKKLRPVRIGRRVLLEESELRRVVEAGRDRPNTEDSNGDRQ